MVCRSVGGRFLSARFTTGEGTWPSSFRALILTGQTVLVTAAARGLGRACALAFAKAGADVALGLRDVKSGQGQERWRRRDRDARTQGPAAADGCGQARSDRERHRPGRVPLRQDRRAREQCGHRAGEPGRERQRGGFRRHAGGQSEGYVLRRPGRGPAHDQAQGRQHRQYELAGRHGGAQGRADLLHDQGGHRPPHPLPRQ